MEVMNEWITASMERLKQDAEESYVITVIAEAPDASAAIAAAASETSDGAQSDKRTDYWRMICVLRKAAR